MYPVTGTRSFENLVSFHYDPRLQQDAGGVTQGDVCGPLEAMHIATLQGPNGPPEPSEHSQFRSMWQVIESAKLLPPRLLVIAVLMQISVLAYCSASIFSIFHRVSGNLSLWISTDHALC